MPKTNKYFFVYYDEDNLSQLVEWLTSSHYSCLISPLHDSDHWTKSDIQRYCEHQGKLYGVKITPEDETWERPVKDGGWVIVDGHRQRKRETVKMPRVGDLKKPHRHVLVKYDYSVMATQVRDEFAEAGLQIAYFEPVKSERGAIRYLAHLDNPEKASYSRDDVISLGGYDLQPLYDELRQDKNKAFGDLIQLMRKKPKYDLRAMTTYCLEQKRIDLCNELRAHATFWRSMLWHDYNKS